MKKKSIISILLIATSVFVFSCALSFESRASDDGGEAESQGSLEYQALSHELARLSVLVESAEIQRSGGAVLPSAFFPAPAGLPGSQGSITGASSPEEVRSIYGPEGPTEKSVKEVLDHNLMLNDDPRLTSGMVIEEEDYITAEIITVDGGLLEEYRIDKKTGLWTNYGRQP